MSKVDATADDTYRYLNFDELPEFVDASDKVEISAEMKEAAKKLDFEDAANLRDRIKQLRNKMVR